MIKQQTITDKYAIYNSDFMYVAPTLENESVDLSVYSPPFIGLYKYSGHPNDLSNCKSKEEFLLQYDFWVKEIARVTKSGRISAVHITDMVSTSSHWLYDFPHEVIKIHEKYGFHYSNRITIWKEPLAVRMETMVKSLTHKMIVQDSTTCFPANPDYLLIFKKTGVNKVPVTHEFGLTHYAGAYPLLIDHLEFYGIQIPELKAIIKNNKSYDYAATIQEYINESFLKIKEKYEGWKDPATNKYSHIIWQRYASSVWDDIRKGNKLQFNDSKEEDDEKHVHPLQLDVIDRVVDLYSNPCEIVLTPCSGVGSEIYSPVSMGRYGIGVELKDSYYKQSVKNLQNVDTRFEVKEKETSLFT